MIWKLKPSAPESFFEKFSKYPRLINQLLYNRGLKTQSEIEEFFYPDYRFHLHNPFKLKDMQKAVIRILRAIDKKQKVLIYGDYDADGVCSSAVLYLALKQAGLENVDVYIPDRQKENHGLNTKAIDLFVKDSVDLIITVDCGCRDLEEVGMANSLGMDVIITDHHETGKKLPNALAVIDPHRPDDNHPFTTLAGVGVALKVAIAFTWAKENNVSEWRNFKMPDSSKWLLDLTALATVADMMPLVGENRVIVKYGLAVLAQTKWLGLKALMNAAGLKPEIKSSAAEGLAPETNLDSYTLGYVLGPRLNAAGRMNHASDAFYLLISDNVSEAERFALGLNQTNVRRQKELEEVTKQAEERIKEKMTDKKRSPQIIFEGDRDWPVGLTGLIAGKLAKRYNRPAIIYNEMDGVVKASCRGAGGLNLIDLMEPYSELMDDFGGHKAAAGFKAEKSRLRKIKKLFLKRAGDLLKQKKPEPALEIDAEILLQNMNWQLYNDLQKFAPTGIGNPTPSFLARNLELTDFRCVGNGGKHLKMNLTFFSQDGQNARNFNAIAFGCDQEWVGDLQKGDLLDLVFELIANNWNGNSNLEMKVLDLKKAILKHKKL